MTAESDAPCCPREQGNHSLGHACEPAIFPLLCVSRNANSRASTLPRKKLLPLRPHPLSSSPSILLTLPPRPKQVSPQPQVRQNTGSGFECLCMT